MHLYSFFNSSTSYRVRIAIALKGLAHQYYPVNLRSGEQKTDQHRELSPIGGVPVLIDDNGVCLTQSMAIIDYLDTLHPEQRLIPSEPVIRARVLELANLIACDMHPVNNLRILGYLQNNLGISIKEKEDWYAHWVEEGFVAVEELLRRNGQGPFCFGASPTVADCCLIPQVANAERMGCDLTAYPLIQRVYRHCLTLPAFKKAAPDKQPDFIQ